MKVHYDKPKGQRVKKGSIKIIINGKKKRIKAMWNRDTYRGDD